MNLEIIAEQEFSQGLLIRLEDPPLDDKHCSPTGADYFGSVAIAANGESCIEWPSDFVAAFPNQPLSQGPFCRNPNGAPAAFCFVAPNRTVPCNLTTHLVPPEERFFEPSGSDYRGNGVSVSNDGPCIGRRPFCAFDQESRSIQCETANGNKTCILTPCCRACGVREVERTEFQINPSVLEESKLYLASAEFDLPQQARYTVNFPQNALAGSLFLGNAQLTSWTEPTSKVLVNFFLDFPPLCLDITLFDAFGDGWDRGLLEIRDCERVLLGSVDFTNGFDKNVQLCVNGAQAGLRFIPIPGSFPDEASWRVRFPDGSESSGLGLGQEVSTCVDFALPQIEAFSSEDVFISPDGSNDDDGLSIDTPIQSLGFGIFKLLSTTDSRVLRLLPGRHTVDSAAQASLGIVNTCFLVTKVAFGDSWRDGRLEFLNCADQVVATIRLDFVAQGITLFETVCPEVSDGFKIVFRPASADAPLGVWSVQALGSPNIIAQGTNTDTKVFSTCECRPDQLTLSMSAPQGGWRGSSLTIEDCGGSFQYRTSLSSDAGFDCIPKFPILSGFVAKMTLSERVLNFNQSLQMTWALSSAEGIVATGSEREVVTKCGSRNTETFHTLRVTQDLPGARVIVRNCSGEVVHDAPANLGDSTFDAALVETGFFVVVGVTPGERGIASWELGRETQFERIEMFARGDSQSVFWSCPALRGAACSDSEYTLVAFDAFESLPEALGPSSNPLTLKACDDQVIFSEVVDTTQNVSFCVPVVALSSGFDVAFEPADANQLVVLVSPLQTHSLISLSSRTANVRRCDQPVKFCNDPQVGDGVCNTRLNRHPCYDGGDCCSHTCTSHMCGSRLFDDSLDRKIAPRNDSLEARAGIYDCRVAQVVVVGEGAPGTVVLTSDSVEVTRPFLRLGRFAQAKFQNIVFDKVQAGDFSPIEMVNGQNELVLQNCSIINHEGGSGCFVHVVRSNVRFESSIMSHNKAFARGAVVSAGDGAVVELVNASVDNNVAQSGGALFAQDSFVFWDGGVSSANNAVLGGTVLGRGTALAVNNVLFTQNKALVVGGALALGVESSLKFVNSTIDGTETLGRGGGIYLVDSSALLKNSTIRECSALLGGAIECVTSGVRMELVTLDLNEAVTRNGVDSGRGGAVHAVGSECNAATLIATNNKAAFGGALYADSVFQVRGAVIQGNAATQAGGVAFFFGQAEFLLDGAISSNTAPVGAVVRAESIGEGGVLRLRGDYSDNIAVSVGGVVSCESAALDVQGSFSNNRVSVLGSGGVFKLENCRADVSGSDFHHNYGGANGGVMSIDTQANSQLDPRIQTQVTDTTFFNNTALEGGAMSLFGQASGIVSSSTFTANTADAQGGAINIRDAVMTIDNCSFVNNRASLGGGVGLDRSFNVQVTNSQFRGNTANQGAGLAAFVAQLKVSLCSFSNNTASVEGGGAFINSASSDTVFEHNTLVDNESKEGAGLRTINSQMIVRFCSFIRNRASINGGGASAIRSAFSQFSFNEFQSNSAGRYGGALYSLDCDTSYSHLVLINNTAAIGGAVSALEASSLELVFDNITALDNTAAQGGAFLFSDGLFAITNSRLMRNTASRCGGLLATRLELQINASDFFDNKALTDSGGALCVQAYDALHVRGSVFHSNVAAVRGGAIDFSDGTQTPSFDDNLFTANRARSSRGGALSGQTQLTQIRNCAFDDNTAQSGGAVSIVGRLEMSGCTLVNNTADGLGGGVEVQGSLVVLRSVFNSNVAREGGGVAVVTGPLALSLSNFTLNLASDSGGALSFNGPNPVTIADCDFIENLAVRDGGALLVHQLSAFNASNTRFLGNIASTGSGAVIFTTDVTTSKLVAPATTELTRNAEGNLAVGVEIVASPPERLTVSIPEIVVVNLAIPTINFTLLDVSGEVAHVTGDLFALLEDTEKGSLSGSANTRIVDGRASMSQLLFSRGCNATHTITFQARVAGLDPIVTQVDVFVDCQLQELALDGLLAAISVFVFINFVFMYLILVNRKSVNITRSSPAFCLLQMFGDTLVLTGAISFISQPTTTTCCFSIGLWCIGFTFAFGSLFLKTWRVWRLFSNNQLKRFAFPNKILMLWLLFLVAIDAIILANYFALDTPTPSPVFIFAEQARFVRCDFQILSPGPILLGVTKGALLVVGVVLALYLQTTFSKFSGNQAYISDFNEGKLIGYCLYSIFMLVILLVPLIRSISETQWELQTSLVCVIVFVLTEFNVILLFPPKIYVLFRDGKFPEGTPAWKKIYAIFHWSQVIELKAGRGTRSSISNSNAHSNSGIQAQPL